eukprot:237294-Chlamydomonas_euryale.AAC.1
MVRDHACSGAPWRAGCRRCMSTCADRAACPKRRWLGQWCCQSSRARSGWGLHTEQGVQGAMKWKES